MIDITKQSWDGNYQLCSNDTVIMRDIPIRGLHLLKNDIEQILCEAYYKQQADKPTGEH